MNGLASGGRIWCARVGVLLVTLGSAVVIHAPAAEAAPNEVGTICSVGMDYPHLSGTAGSGAVAKARFSCERGSMTVTAYLINLYLCPSKPSGSESQWTSTYGCRVVAENNGINSHDQPFSVGASTVTRQVPAPGSSPVHGSGYWAACVRYTANIYSGERRTGAIAPAAFAA